MMRPKLYTWLEPGTDEYKIVVHAYFHLMQSERFMGLVSFGVLTNAPQATIDKLQEISDHHWAAFEFAVETMPMFRGYLLERQLERIEKRVTRQGTCMLRDMEQFLQESGGRSNAARARRKARARYN